VQHQGWGGLLAAVLSEEVFRGWEEVGRDPGSGAFLTLDPGSGMGRKSASGSGIRDEQLGSYFLELINQFFGFLGLKDLNSLMRSGLEKSRIRDPGFGINIPDPQHWHMLS
jgi:hypothetical protein